MLRLVFDGLACHATFGGSPVMLSAPSLTPQASTLAHLSAIFDTFRGPLCPGIDASVGEAASHSSACTVFVQDVRACSSCRSQRAVTRKRARRAKDADGEPTKASSHANISKLTVEQLQGRYKDLRRGFKKVSRPLPHASESAGVLVNDDNQLQVPTQLDDFIRLAVFYN